MDANTGQNETR